MTASQARRKSFFPSLTILLISKSYTTPHVVQDAGQVGLFVYAGSEGGTKHGARQSQRYPPTRPPHAAHNQ